MGLVLRLLLAMEMEMKLLNYLLSLGYVPTGFLVVFVKFIFEHLLTWELCFLFFFLECPRIC